MAPAAALDDTHFWSNKQHFPFCFFGMAGAENPPPLGDSTIFLTWGKQYPLLRLPHWSWPGDAPNRAAVT